MPQAVPGWKVVVTKAKLAKPLEVHGKQINEAVSKVTWTADGGKIEPGEFQQFPLSVGQLPEDADQLVFKALQTYDNKEVVRWIEEPKEGAAEPENPAPVLKLTAGDGGPPRRRREGRGREGRTNAGHDRGALETVARDSSDTTARVLGIVGIVIGVAGVAFGVLRRPSPLAPDLTAPRTRTTDQGSSLHAQEDTVLVAALVAAAALSLSRLRRRRPATEHPSPSVRGQAKPARDRARPAVHQAGPRPHRHPRQAVRPARADQGQADTDLLRLHATAPTCAR